MIIIFNASGLLIGFAGCMIGLVAGALTGSLAVALLVLSATWIGLGLVWRNSRGAGAPKRPFPSLFFIPLPFLAIVTVILALLAIPIDLRSKSESRGSDPREQTFRSAESSLRGTNASGDVPLSTLVHRALSSTAHAGAIPSSLNVYTDSNDKSVLVLVKVGNLKEFSEDARRSMLNTVAAAIKSEPLHQTKDLYVGVKGAVLYGAIQTPTQTIISTTSHSALLEYFSGSALAPQSSPFPALPTETSSSSDGG